MDIWTLSEKAELIASKQQCLLKQWRQYCNALIQGVTLSKAKLYQTIRCDSDDGLHLSLFDYFVIHIRLAVGFNSHTIEYVLEQRDEGNNILIASAIIDNEGHIDNTIDNNNREQVLEHYLRLIHPVYEGLYQAVEENMPLSLALLQHCQSEGGR
ncbi:formate hydrogenlyase regulator HycA [Enterobacter asburiae]